MPAIHTLAADVPLTKSLGTARDGSVDKRPYPNAFRFTSTSHNVRTIDQLYKVIVDAAEAQHCVVKGDLNKQLQDEPRAGSTDSYGETQWVCLDIDKSSKLSSPEHLLALIGASDVSYVVQYSSSYGVEHNGNPLDKRLSCHIFMLLDKSISAQLLKQWLFGLNFTHLYEETTLTASANSLSYTLDVTTCQNDKLLYVAPPVFLDNKFTDVLGEDRIQLVKKKKPALTINVGEIPSKSVNYAKIATRVDELRAAAGLPKRSKGTAIKHHDKLNVMYLAKPDQATVTSVKEERGYVYLNLNGGDSWGYYFPSDDCEVVRNFKGEPNYLLKELAPDFYARRKKEQTERAKAENTIGTEQQKQEGRYYMAFRDFKSSDYFNGWYDHETDQLTLMKAKNANQLRDFLMQYNLPVPEAVPDWNIVYNPHSPLTLDVDNRIINQYKASPYDYSELVPPGDWSTILKVVDHALGTNQAEYPESIRNEVRTHFLNWLAYVIQNKKPAQTAWVLHGVPGTGKGTLYHRVFKPLFGASNCVLKHAEDFTSQFTGWLANNVLVFVDEVQMNKLRDSKLVEAKLRTWLTEPFIDIREMYRQPYNAPNHNSFIFASNQVDAVIIPVNDRRYNVALYQERRWFPDEEELQRIDDELVHFYMYLMQVPVDENMVRKIVNTSARNQMIEVSKLAIDELAEQLNTGNLVWFFDQLPNDEAYVPPVEQGKLERYKDVLLEWLDNAAAGKRNVLRDHLQAACQWIMGDVPIGSYKFSQYVRHHQLHVKQVAYHSVNQQGVNMTWQVYEPSVIQALRERLARGTAMPVEQAVEEAKVTPTTARGRKKKNTV